MDFKSLKKNSSLEKLNAKLEEQTKGTNNFNTEKEEEFYTLKRDKAGNGYAIIRFLPAPPQDGDDGLPWVKYFRHSFKNKSTGKWYIERSLTSFGEDDPCGAYNTKLWNTGIEANKTIARNQKRKQVIVSNILVEKDDTQPECVGKVFKFRYGVKIFEKIENKMHDQEEESRFNPFDFWEGASFKLKVKNIDVDGQKVPNYDDCEWMPPKPLFGGDEKKLEALWKQQYSLLEVNDRKHYKTYAELQVSMNRVLGLDGNNNVTSTESNPAPSSVESTKPKIEPIMSADEVLPESNTVGLEPDDDESIMAAFQKLADGS